MGLLSVDCFCCTMMVSMSKCISEGSTLPCMGFSKTGRPNTTSYASLRPIGKNWLEGARKRHFCFSNSAQHVFATLLCTSMPHARLARTEFAHPCARRGAQKSFHFQRELIWVESAWQKKRRNSWV